MIGSDKGSAVLSRRVKERIELLPGSSYFLDWNDSGTRNRVVIQGRNKNSYMRNHNGDCLMRWITSSTKMHYVAAKQSNDCEMTWWYNYWWITSEVKVNAPVLQEDYKARVIGTVKNIIGPILERFHITEKYEVPNVIRGCIRKRDIIRVKNQDGWLLRNNGLEPRTEVSAK